MICQFSHDGIGWRTRVKYFISEGMKDAMQPLYYWKNDLKKIQAFSERDSNTLPLRYRCNALPTELSKPHESGRVWVRPFIFSGRNTRLKYVNFMVIGVQQ